MATDLHDEEFYVIESAEEAPDEKEPDVDESDDGPGSLALLEEEDAEIPLPPILNSRAYVCNSL